MVEHSCTPPLLNAYPTSPMQPDWECAICGRLWRDWNGGGTGSVRWWAEVRGPTNREGVSNRTTVEDA